MWISATVLAPSGKLYVFRVKKSALKKGENVVGQGGTEKDSQYCFPWNTSRNTNGASGPWFCPQMTQTTAVWTLSVLRHWCFIFPIKALKPNALKKKKKWMHVTVKGKSELLWGTGREGWVTGGEIPNGPSTTKRLRGSSFRDWGEKSLAWFSPCSCKSKQIYNNFRCPKTWIEEHLLFVK